MPTFVFISENGEIDRMQGASPQGLKTKIQNWINYLGPVAAAAPSKPNPKAANEAEKSWLSQFVKYSDKVMEYEDEIAQTLAKSLIPLEELLKKVSLDGKRNDFLLASDLMNWFHDEFFEWTDTPKCKSCNEKTSKDTRSNGTPTEEEKNEGDAQRVEVYFC
uniref:Sulfhydryl oxidase n=1 Tax=Panagrolaimus sp. JU765 TaxID=591449 RepID=A0AC34RLB9_9BILA